MVVRTFNLVQDLEFALIGLSCLLFLDEVDKTKVEKVKKSKLNGSPEQNVKKKKKKQPKVVEEEIDEEMEQPSDDGSEEQIDCEFKSSST